MREEGLSLDFRLGAGKYKNPLPPPSGYESICIYIRILFFIYIYNTLLFTVGPLGGFPIFPSPLAKFPFGVTNSRNTEKLGRFSMALATTAYTLGRAHTCIDCEESNIPCTEQQPEPPLQFRSHTRDRIGAKAKRLQEGSGAIHG